MSDAEDQPKGQLAGRPAAASSQDNGQTPPDSLERRKLRLETEALERAATWKGQLTNWLQAAAIPATIGGIFFSFVIGTTQVHQAEDARTDDRFDKTLTRLASTQAADRMSGVSGLRLFIENGEVTRRSDAVEFLIDALANEKDPEVQSAILSVIADLKKQGMGDAAIQQALESTLERNRSLTSWLNEQLVPSDAAIRRLIAQKTQLNPEAIRGIAPDKLEQMANLTGADFRSALPTERLFVWRISADTAFRLKGLSKAVTELVAEGARASDFSGIFCEACDFTPARDLSRTNFDSSYLSNANFSHMTLQSASFRDADLSNTNFFAANLKGADLSSKEHRSVVRLNQTVTGLNGSIPFLDCADLSGADLTGLPLIVVWENLLDSDSWSTGIFASNLSSAIIDNSTKFGRLGIVLNRTASDSMLNDDRVIWAELFNAKAFSVIAGRWGANEYRFSNSFDDPHSAARAEADIIELEDYSVEGRVGGQLKHTHYVKMDDDDTLNGFLPKYLKHQPLWNVVSLRTLADTSGLVVSAISLPLMSKNSCSIIGQPNIRSLIWSTYKNLL